MRADKKTDSATIGDHSGPQECDVDKGGRPAPKRTIGGMGALGNLGRVVSGGLFLQAAAALLGR